MRDVNLHKSCRHHQGDKAQTQTYCQIEDLTEQLDQAVQQKDIKKARALVEKIAELNKKMGPEFAALVDIEKRVDLNSPDGQEIASIVASLGEFLSALIRLSRASIANGGTRRGRSCLACRARWRR